MSVLTPTMHTFIGLLIGILLLIAPWLLGFHEVGGIAVAVPLITGAFIILNELITSSHASPMHVVPMRMHLALDFVIGALLAASPWLFAFSSQAPGIWIPHVLIGIGIIAYAAMTQPEDERVPVLS